MLVFAPLGLSADEFSYKHKEVSLIQNAVEDKIHGCKRGHNPQAIGRASSIE